LSGASTAAHIHGPTAMGMNSWFGTSNPPFAAGVKWTLTHGAALSNYATDSFAGVTAQESTDLMGGKYYFNVHTAANGGGEIRGQVTALRCYPYRGAACPTTFPQPPSGSSSSSTGSGPNPPGGAASHVAVSFMLVGALAAIAALFQ
jgi:hypothetical protein